MHFEGVRVVTEIITELKMDPTMKINLNYYYTTNDLTRPQ